MPENPHHPHVNVDALAKRAEGLLADLAELLERINEIRKSKSPNQINGQLKAIGDTIRKLEKQGIAIPDELRRLKINLASDLCRVEEVERVRAKVSEQLGQALAQLGTAYYMPAHPVPQPGVKGRKRKLQDPNVLDLFGWKNSAGGANP
jgi:septal ring factor EnvC (AmiA/AmiB activator)